MRKGRKEKKRLRTPDPDNAAPADPAGKPAGRHNDRRCIASGAALGPRDPAIRFVRGPDGTAVPDLAEKLPGRGAWLAADRALVVKAAEKGLFSRGFKTKTGIAADSPAAFADDIEAALERRALEALGLARRAGALVTGYEKTRSAVQKGSAAAYIHASDAAADGVSRILAVAGPALPVWHAFAGETLDRAIGEANVVHLALIDQGMAARFGREVKRLTAYLGTGG